MKLLKKLTYAASIGLGLIAVASCDTEKTPTTSVSTSVATTPTTVPTVAPTTTTTNLPTKPSTTTTPVGENQRKIYAAPNGTSTADGTRGNPYDIYTAWNSLAAGTTLILLEGEYDTPQRLFASSIENVITGEPGNPVVVKNDDGAKVTLNFQNQLIGSTSRGIQINTDYWYFYGLDIMAAGDNGLYIAGSYNTVENCTFHDNQDAGLQIGRASSEQLLVDQWPHNNLVKNCTSYNNYDYTTFGENADGFAAKLTNGHGNVFDGCIAYRNADDGWDLYAKSDSGSVGTTIIRNSVAFENGWLLNPNASPSNYDLDQYNRSTIKTTKDIFDKIAAINAGTWTSRSTGELVTLEQESLTYTTRDGDGIGFKLGGSSMEGNVITDNCLSFSNKLHGFSDNSNPGVLTMRNCTAYNNSVAPDPITGEAGPSDKVQKSNNFDLSRTEESYNNYYGLLSYTTNQDDPTFAYSNSDMFRGSTGYCIFNVGKNKYTAFTEYQDANSYDSTKSGRAYNDLNDSCFASTEFGYVVNGNEDFHQILRNPDGSVNMGTMMLITDSKLLNFCGEGQQIGAKLNYTSDAEYKHYGFSGYLEVQRTEEDLILQGAYDALEIMCNPEAVYQNVKLLTSINGCKVTWESQNEKYIEAGERDKYNPEKIIEYVSVSGVRYIEGILYRDRTQDQIVSLLATITYNGKSIQKTFTFNVKQDVPQIGNVVGFEDRYILTTFTEYQVPAVEVENASNYSGQTLILGTDYTYTTTILYAQSSADFASGNYYEISKVYTSYPGVYKVIYKVESLISEEILETSFYAYVVSEDAKIDFAVKENGNADYEANVCRDGVQIAGRFTNILGDLYILGTTADSATREEIIANGTKYAITDETLTAILPNDNNDAYNVFFVVANKNKTYFGEVHSVSINVETISTTDQFRALISSSTLKTTIYKLTNDLDFTGVWWVSSTQPFGGLFNGNGYTIRNITVKGSEKKDTAIFYKLENGTIMNVNFENIVLQGAQGTASLAGIVGQMAGGYLHNIGLKNITSYAHTGAGTLVGQISGGVNYVTQVSLVNEETSTITVSNKYSGGLIGNVQKDTAESVCEAYVSNCYVKATVGDAKDSGGYIGGIIGRTKNDYDVCKLVVEKCYFEGKVLTGKNYAGGICAGSDNGAGHIEVNRCVSNVEIYYVEGWLNATTGPHKNGSPIWGRYSAGQGIFKGTGNFGSFSDSQMVSDSELFYETIVTKTFWQIVQRFDLENIWIWDEATSTISLRTPTHQE